MSRESRGILAREKGLAVRKGFGAFWTAFAVMHLHLMKAFLLSTFLLIMDWSMSALLLNRILQHCGLGGINCNSMVCLIEAIRRISSVK